MPRSEPVETCILLPCRTLEDFPSHLDREHAEGVLAAWTAAWHPAAILATGRPPMWYRADSPPEEMAGRIFLVPTASRSQLPRSLSATPERPGEEADFWRIDVTDRAAAVAQLLEIPPLAQRQPAAAAAPPPSAGQPEPPGDVASEGGTVADFFAFGYAYLQVQLMTRQLRYSSNLDEVYVGEQALQAAQAWQRGATAETVETLQRLFDVLAEERDHYFSSDPHLVALTLLAPTTLDEPLVRLLDSSSYPLNLLLSAETAEALALQNRPALERIVQRIEAGSLSLCGGAPDDQTALDLFTADQVGRWLDGGRQRIASALGTKPAVFARLGGGVPGDLVPWLLRAGYRGALTVDFTAGTGFHDESKLLWQSGAAEIEALTARPLDAADPRSFMKLGPRLGELTDSGDVATALLVHWPGTGCDAFDDLCRAARWGLALGKFWTLGQYFDAGERPYHTCQPSAVGDAGPWLQRAVSAGQTDPISGAAAAFIAQLAAEASSMPAALARLIDPATPESLPSSAPPASNSAKDSAPDADRPRHEPLAGAAAALLALLGGQRAAASAGASQTTVFNPHSAAGRVLVELPDGSSPQRAGFVYGSAEVQGRTRVAVDVPPMGFVQLRGGGSPRRNWFRWPKPIAQGNMLANQFMTVTINAKSGGIGSVHSGPGRSNRFSLQLAHFDAGGPGDGYSQMLCDSLQTLEANPAVGQIEAQGRLMSGDSVVARFVAIYHLEMGSRWLRVDVRLTPEVELGAEPWRSYFAARAAWPMEASTVHPIVRDQLHRARVRRLAAPLGAMVDETDRTTMISGQGLPLHRRVGDRMLDTLLIVRGESRREFRLHYGFDLKNPVAAARALLAPPVALTGTAPPLGADSGWLFHLDARNVLASAWAWQPPDELPGGGESGAGGAGPEAALRVRLVETAGRTITARLRCYRPVAGAERLGSSRAPEVDGDAVRLTLSGHETTELVLRFTDASKSE